MKIAARILFPIFLFLISYFLFLRPSAFAQTTVQPPQNLHNYTQNVMIEVMSSMTCLIAGVDSINPSQKCLGVANGKIGPVDAKGGALGVVGNLIAMTFNPPFHTGDYVRYLASDFGITKHAYAQQQGIGFQSLNPLIEIWKAFRNIVYLLFVLVFVTIGFAIMLRIHIDPRTVMTIENQIPKIIIGLILVTFSFAIAGLLIDLMWVLIYLSISIFQDIPVNVGSFSNLQGLNALQAADGIGGIWGIATNGSAGVGGFISGLFQGPAGNIIAAIILGAAGAGLGGLGGIPGIVAGLIGGIIVGGLTGNAALGLIGQVIAFLIFSLAMLFALFRLWFTLIKNYVMILLITVFSPFWILGSIAPGSKITFGSFLRELASRLMAFPATIIMFMLGKAFIDIFEGPGRGSTFVPPLIGNPGDYKAIGALIGLGIILLTPEVVNMVRKFTLDFGAIGAGVGAGVSTVNPINMIGRATQLGSTLYWAHQTPVLRGILGRMGIKPITHGEPQPQHS